MEQQNGIPTLNGKSKPDTQGQSNTNTVEQKLSLTQWSNVTLLARSMAVASAVICSGLLADVCSPSDRPVTSANLADCKLQQSAHQLVFQSDVQTA